MHICARNGCFKWHELYGLLLFGYLSGYFFEKKSQLKNEMQNCERMTLQQCTMTATNLA